MSFEWPWQVNDDTGQTHFEENFLRPVGAAAFDSTVGIWVNPAYSLGGFINANSGGTGGAPTVGTALFDSDRYPVAEYSPTVMNLSAYDPGEPVADGQFGDWQVPVFNRYMGDAFNLPDVGDWWEKLKKAALWVAGGFLALQAIQG